MKISLKKYLKSLEEATSEELHLATKSSLQSKMHNGIKVHIFPHSGARAHTRRPDMESHHWDDLMYNMTKNLKNKPAGHYLTYSKKHQQGVVGEWMPHKNRIEVMSVLPKGKSHPNQGTIKHIVEEIIITE